MVICIDFDGTIVEHAFPVIGEPLPLAFEVMAALKAEGHHLILWTCREDHPTRVDRDYLRQAVEFCRSRGIEFDAVNEAIVDMDFREFGKRRKPHAHCVIDDRNLGGFPGWGVVAQVLGVSVVA